MMRPPAALGERYEVEFYGDDIVWLRVDEADGRVYGMNPEYGTSRSSHPSSRHPYRFLLKPEALINPSQ